MRQSRAGMGTGTNSRATAWQGEPSHGRMRRDPGTGPAGSGHKQDSQRAKAPHMKRGPWTDSGA